jgi:hypothetical protein
MWVPMVSAPAQASGVPATPVADRRPRAPDLRVRRRGHRAARAPSGAGTERRGALSRTGTEPRGHRAAPESDYCSPPERSTKPKASDAHGSTRIRRFRGCGARKRADLVVPRPSNRVLPRLTDSERVQCAPHGRCSTSGQGAARGHEPAGGCGWRAVRTRNAAGPGSRRGGSAWRVVPEARNADGPRGAGGRSGGGSRLWEPSAGPVPRVLNCPSQLNAG